MKKIFKLTSLCALLLGLAAACGGNEVTPPSGETLDTPTGLTVGTLTATTAELLWTAVAGAETYKVMIDAETPVDVTEASCEATGLTGETGYTWKVQAVKGGIVSEWSAVSEFTTPLIVVAPPSGLLAADITYNSAMLTWQHADADSHEVVIGNMEAVDVTGLSCETSILIPDTKYTWQVRSCKDGIWSEWAQGEQFTTEGAPVTPAPTGLTVADVFDKGATLSWQHDNADSHEVVIDGREPIILSGRSYNAVGLSPTTTYKWKVRSRKYGVWSDWAEGGEFTTNILRILSYSVGGWLVYYDEAFGPGTQSFQCLFVDYDPAVGWGIQMKLAFCFSKAELDVDSGRRTIELPATTYTVTNDNETPAVNTIMDFYSYIEYVEAGVSKGRKYLKSGTMTATKDSAGIYNMLFDFILDDDTAFKAEYIGTYIMNNPKAR